MPEAINFSSGLIADAANSSAPRPSKVAEAARQFEGLMLNQLLKSAGSSEDGGWLGTGENDQAGLQAMELAQEQFAAALAAKGGMGLANLVISNLGKDEK